MTANKREINGSKSIEHFLGQKVKPLLLVTFSAE